MSGWLVLALLPRSLLLIMPHNMLNNHDDDATKANRPYENTY